MNEIPPQNDNTIYPDSIPQNTPSEHSSKEENRPQRPTPTWKQRLYQRGLSDSTIEHFELQPAQTGWVYPLQPDLTHKRWKAFDSSATPKYLWQPNKPHGVTFYDPDGRLTERIIEAGGVLWLAGGEPDVWALWEAGITHATCTFDGESSLPDGFAIALQELDVTALHIAPDCDDAGCVFAAKVRAALDGTGINLTVHQLPFAQDSKGDIGALLLQVGSDSLRAALEALPEMDSGALCAVPPKPTEGLPGISSDLYDQWCKEVVEPEALRTWHITEPGSNEFSTKPFACPFHTDTHPSAYWNYHTHGVYCHSCGDHNTHDVAEQLNIQSWEEYKASQRKSQSQSAGGPPPQTIAHATGDTSASKPSHDELGDGLIDEWDGEVAYFRENWYRYIGGCWYPEENIARHIWNIQKFFKDQGVRPNKSTTASIEAYLKARLHVPDDFIDAGDDFVNLKNGLYNLKTSSLESHRLDLYLTSQLGFAYDPAATCPTWQMCLKQWFAKPDGTVDEELVALLQEAFGYSLTTDTRFQVAFWLYGEAGSGKSTAIAALKTLMGSAYVEIDLSALHRNHYQLAEIEGKRVVSCTEAAANSVLTDNIFKQLVSGEELVARQIRQRSRRFKPQAKVWWAMNEMPRNQDRSNAVYRRLTIIPFLNPIPDAQRDLQLDQKLEAEAPGIFRWALEGLQRLRTRGRFTRASQVQEALVDYRSENDAEAQFVAEWCIVNKSRSTQASTLYLAYRAWCEQFGHKYKSKTKVARDWKRLGFGKAKRSDGNYYTGVELTSEAAKAAKRILLSL